MEQLVLYVAKDKMKPTEYCRGSTMCLKFVEVLPSDMVNVQDCDKLSSKNIEFPAWLNGTPTLVDKQTGDVYKGTLAVRYLRNALEEYSEKRQMTKHRTKGSTPSQDVRPSILGEEEEKEEEEDAHFDTWDNELKDAEERAASLQSQPKATQQDVEEFMRRRQQSMPQPDQNGGSVPTIEQEQS